MLGGHYPASSLLRTHPPGSRLRRTSPFGSCGYLASAEFLDGARSPSLLQPMALCACRRLYPAERRSPMVALGNRLLPSPRMCGLGARGFRLSGPQPVVHRIVTARALASPPSGDLSVGFARGISPAGATQAMRLRPSAASGLSPYGSIGTSRHHTSAHEPDWASASGTPSPATVRGAWLRMRCTATRLSSGGRCAAARCRGNGGKPELAAAS